MTDPRTLRFNKLRKRDLSQLTAEEARYVVGVCCGMAEYVRRGYDRKAWLELADRYTAQAAQAEQAGKAERGEREKRS